MNESVGRRASVCIAVALCLLAGSALSGGKISDPSPEELAASVLNEGNAARLETVFDEPEHRYYRVYMDGKQIASTVATSLPVKVDDVSRYAVKSVDKWNNEGK